MVLILFQVEVHLVALTGLDILRRSLAEVTHWLFVLTKFWKGNQLSRNELLRLRFAAGESLSELARAFGISPQRAYQIAHFKRK